MDNRRQLRILRRILLCLGIWSVFVLWMQYVGLDQGDWKLREVNAVPDWFEEHKEGLFQIRNILLRHDAIRSVQPYESHYRAHFRKFTDADHAAHESVDKLIRKLRIVRVVVYRNDDSQVIVDYFLRSEMGLAVLVSNYTNGTPDDWNVPPDSLTYLGEPNWYVQKLTR